MVEGDGEKEIIAETLRPGYYYEGEILRPAMVKVRKI
jgi:molecular chaperone GrpE (heat shock protein)